MFVGFPRGEAVWVHHAEHHQRLPYIVGGAVGAAVWGMQEGLDQRIGGSRYSDIELLGRMVSRRRWWGAGMAMHIANGVAFGLLYSAIRKRTKNIPPIVTASALALGEHTALWPLNFFSDRLHPAIRRGEIPRISTDKAAFAQGAWRHAIMAAALTVAAERARRST